MKKNTLFFGAIVLLLTNALTKICGFGYRIVLVRILGAEGIGLTEMVTPIYSFCIVIASWGVPLAMSRMIAAHAADGDIANIRRICRIGMAMLLLGGTVVSLVSYFAAPLLIGNLVTDQRTLACFRLLTPAIFLIAVCSGYRAYFQGIKDIAPLGIAQNIEQIVRIGCGIALAIYLLPQGLTVAICAVALASVAGEAAGLCYMLLHYRQRRRRQKLLTQPSLSQGKIIAYLLKFGTPVTLQRLFSSSLAMLQAFLIPYLLQQSGQSPAGAAILYGALTGVAMSLLNLPSVFTSTLGTIILPSVAETNRPRLQHYRINAALHATVSVSLPLALLLFFYAEPLCRLLFHTVQAVLPLQILACGALVIYLQTPLVSILQGLGQVRSLFSNQIISACLLVAALLLLVPRFGIEGAACSTLLFQTCYCLLNLWHLKRYSGICYCWSQILRKPLLAVAIAAGILKAAAMLTAALNPYLAMLLSATLACAAYIGLLLLLHAFPHVRIGRTD